MPLQLNFWISENLLLVGECSAADAKFGNAELKHLFWENFEQN